MAETKGTLDTMREDAVRRAADRIVLTLQVQGVERIRAMEFVEQHVMLRLGPGLKVYAECGETRARGTSDEHLTYFAREVHLFHDDVLGGRPVPFGSDPGPEFEGVTEKAATIAADRKANTEAVARQEAQRAALAQQHREDAVAMQLEGRPDPRRAF